MSETVGTDRAPAPGAVTVMRRQLRDRPVIPLLGLAAACLRLRRKVTA